MSLYGSLFASVAGIQSQSNALGIIADNIANANTVGYKGASSLFQTLVTPNGSTSQYSPGGVLGGNRQLVDKQGLVQATASPTDIAISGSGFFVVTTDKTDANKNQVEFTRAGSFTQDSLGNFVNASGLYLKAWHLQSDGSLPAGSGNVSSLEIVNLKNTSGTASSTTAVNLSLNLNAGEAVFPGSAETIAMDNKDPNNFGITGSDIIVGNDFGAAANNLIRRGTGVGSDTGDVFTITTVDGSGTAAPLHTYQYGGFTTGRSVTGATNLTLFNNAAFSVPATDTTVTVKVADAQNLPPVGTTFYVNIEGAVVTGAFASAASVEGIRQATVATSIANGDATNTFTFEATAASINGAPATFGGSGATVDPSPGDRGSGDNLAQSPATTLSPLIQLGTNKFNVTGGNNTITVTVDNGGLAGLGPVGSQRYITIGGLQSGDFGSTGFIADDFGTSQLVTITSTGFTFNATKNAVGSGPFGGSTATVDDFTGNILDASSATTGFLSFSGPTLFTSSALTFKAVVGGVTHVFTYTGSSPDASAGQFNNMNNLASAISATGDLTARVVDGRLYVSATDANKAVSFLNGDATGSISGSGAKGGIDWVGELDLKDIQGVTGTSNRFNTMQGLAALVNSTTDMAAKVINATSTASLAINVKDPRGTIQFKDGASNTGSILGEFGLSDVNGNSLSLTGAFAPKDTGTVQPKYDSGDTNKNLASGAIAAQFSRSVTVFDSLGTAHNINVDYLKTGVNEWAVEAYISDNSSTHEISETGSLVDGQIAVGTIKFNGDGSLLSVSSTLTAEAKINWNSGAISSSITFDWGTFGTVGTGKTDGLSQFNANYSLNFINQNGDPSGQLTSVAIDGEGYITATFTNGEVQKLYKIPLADFKNANGLQSVSGNAFAQSNNSGAFNLREAGQNGVGSISPSSLESSNVELSDQLTNMIVAQRAYEANTKIITTVDTLLQELNQVFQ